jgi:hypothetical protein
MPTPLTPDEEFDALFRQGLEHHPEQPETPAAWHRMDLLLDADLRQQALRRKVLRMLGAESVLLLLLLWSAWVLVGQQFPIAPDNGRAMKGLTHSAKTAPTTAPATTSGKFRPEATLATQSAPAAIPTSQPEDEQAAPSAQMVPAAPNKALALAAKTGSATDKATTNNNETASTSHLITALGEAKRHHHNKRSRTPTEGQSLTAEGNHFGTIAEQQETHSGPKSAVSAAAKRQFHSLALAAAKRPEKPKNALFWRGAKAAQPASSAYPAAGSVAGISQNRTHAQRQYLGQQLTTNNDLNRGHRSGSRRARPAGDAAIPATNDNSFGTAIDLLALHVPANNLTFTLPDSLRPVALATRPAPADSLAPPLPQPQRYRFRLGLVAAPELSTVRTSRLSPPGPSVGVQLDYQLARRWRLSTAFLYSVKRYTAAGADYTVPYTMPHGWVITDVDAVCRIIDIPLNLRYDLWQRPRHQVFVSAGLSSLLMKREQYTYDYGLVYGKPVPSYTFDVSNGSQHLLKVLNLSVGYERLLGQRWSVQAEPFVKLPLAGVGYGAVRLRSAGVFFSLRYGLLPVRPAPAPGLR